MKSKVEYKVLESMITAIDNNLRTAIGLNAMYSRATFEEDIPENFNNTFEAWGFNISTISLYIHLVLCLSRMLDEDPNSASIPSLLAYLESRDVVEELKDKARNWHSAPIRIAGGHWDESTEELSKELSNEQAEESARRVLQAIERAKDEYRKLKGSHYLQSLRTLRNQQLAHTELSRDKGKARTAKHGDPEELLCLIRPIVEQLDFAIRGMDPDRSETETVWRTWADCYWKSAAHL